MVKHLSAAGANVDRVDRNGESPLICAADKGDVAMMQLLLEHGANPNIIAKTVLIDPVWKNNVEAVETLVSFDTTDLELRDCYERTAIQCAVEAQVPAIVEILCDAGANIHHVHGGDMTALMLAVFYNQIDIVEILVQRGVDVDQISGNGMTALQYAYRVDVIEILLSSCQADVSHIDNVGISILIHAAQSGYADDAVNVLFAHGAAIDHGSQHHETAFIEAATLGHDGIVALLLAAGANVNNVDLHENSALLRAAMGGHMNVVELLLAHGRQTDNVGVY